MLRVMLIDDEQPALDLLEKLLIANGDIGIVGTFVRPDEALDRLKKESVDVVFLDIEMPGMDGIEAAEHITAIDSGIDIVFVTAYNQYAIEAFEMNVIDYVLKPTTTGRLNKTIERIVARRSMEKRGERADAGGAGAVGFFCFGRFELVSGAEAPTAVKWRMSKERELMAYLVHNRNKFVPKDKILEDLWANAELERSSAFLHTCVYSIRKKLAYLGWKNRLEYKNNGYRLEISGLRCDADEFERVASRTIAGSLGSIGEFERIMSLYSGDYMEEDGFVWAHEAQERFKDAYIVLMKRMTDYYMSVNEYRAAANCLRCALQKNPFLDDINETMLRAYALMGDRLSMVSHYERFTKLLKEELGIAPMESTVQLFSQLCSGSADDVSKA